MKYRHSWCLALFLSLVAGLWAALPVAAQRSLYWSSMAVKAHLDADGTLEVEERQDMVFTGAWNGGERIFRVAPGQSLVLDSLSRLDPATGEEHPLSAGNLNGVDHFAWVSSNKLRWRSRLPSDPSFDHTPITYVLRYRLAGIVLQEGNRYRLDHDFAFPDREGEIQRFSLDLSFDPAWQPMRTVKQHYDAGPLLPGQSFVLDIPMTYEGSSPPADVRRAVPASWRWGVLFLLLAAAGASAASYNRRERELGRFEPGPPLASIDRSWLEENLFDLRPEEAGAAWDESVGAPEVAALLARLVAEKRLKSTVQKKGIFKSSQELELELLTPLESFEPYEKKLLEGLFFDGETKTSTSVVRKHYKSTGFDPSSLIREPIEQRLSHLPVMRGKGPKLGAKRVLPWLCLLLGGLAVTIVGAARNQATAPFYILMLFISVAALVAGSIGAYSWRRRLLYLYRATWWFLLPVAVPLAILCWVATRPLTVWILPLGLSIFWLGIALEVMWVAASRDDAEKLAFRRRLATAREWLRGQLKLKQPDLEDLWMPYLLAFGLGHYVDRWSQSFGTAVPRVDSFGGSSSGSTGGGWTGGGGSFGGAGASGAWVAAAGSLAAGVSAPSSSGGGGGGGSSGGGGGGGW